MTNISWREWRKFATRLLPIPQKYRVPFKLLSMRWILHMSNSSLLLIPDYILLENAKLNKLANKLWNNFPDGRDSLITRSWSLFLSPYMKPTERAWAWKKTMISTDAWDQYYTIFIVFWPRASVRRGSLCNPLAAIFKSKVCLYVSLSVRLCVCDSAVAFLIGRSPSDASVWCMFKKVIFFSRLRCVVVEVNQ